MSENIVRPVVNTSIAPQAPLPTVTQTSEVVDPSVQNASPIKEDDTPQKTPAESVLNSNVPYQMDPLFHEVASYFNIEPADWDGAKTKLSAIVDYIAQSIDSGDAGDIMLKLREMEDTIQPPQWGEKRYNNIYKYVRLAQQRSSIDKAMNSFKKGII